MTEPCGPAVPLERKTLSDGTVSQLTIVPFYDRTGLIYETLGTLNTALTDQQEQLGQLQELLKKLHEQLAEISSSSRADVAHEPPPPHY